jgi:hypothetical protein
MYYEFIIYIHGIRTLKMIATIMDIFARLQASYWTMVSTLSNQLYSSRNKLRLKKSRKIWRSKDNSLLNVWLHVN